MLARLRAGAEPVPPERLGFIGQECRPDWPGYARKTGTTTTQAGARIPYVVEAWAVCSRPAQKGQGQVRISLLVNRSMTVATIHAHSWPGKIAVRGCGLHRWAEGPGTGDYEVVLSVIAPHVQLATDGKEPSLAPFSEAIAEALRKACGAAHRAMRRPERGVTVKDAAWSVMEEAYRTRERRRPVSGERPPDHVRRPAGHPAADRQGQARRRLLHADPAAGLRRGAPPRRPGGTSSSTPAAASSSRTPAARCGSAPSTSAPTSASGPPSAPRSM